MANNKLKTIGFAFCLTIFFLGGWFLRGIGSHHEVADLYSEDGESLGIFSQIPPEDMAAAQAIAQEALEQDALPQQEKKVIVREDGTKLPSQIALTDMSEIAGIAPKENTTQETDEMVKISSPVDLQLTGLEVASVAPKTIQPREDDDESQITLIAAPVKHFVVHNTDEYKAFKKKARGSYPEVNFTKQQLIVLESDSNLPDNVFELVGAEEQGGELVVTYRVNVFRLDKKINSHTVLAVDKTQLPVQLKQIL